ncbi:uncharacterized protein LOC122513551 [Polistes fuscatus]|uniref:uncharacterized protein LOC122513551 n=1 Tax=Polistes fuscatus TaxID=30207 RepID=UPI001CA862AB|nr:uncharacterized protein LOC122513551 [Polistes fuscatus]
MRITICFNTCKQFLMNQRPDRNSRDQLLFCSVLIIYSIPFYFQMLYELFTTKLIGQSTIKLIQRVISVLIFISAYTISYFRYVTIKLLIVRFKLDHEKFSDPQELNVLEMYTVQSKSFVYALMYKIECILYVTGAAFTVYINFYLGQRLLDHSVSVLEEL